MAQTYFGSDELILTSSLLRQQKNGQTNGTFSFRIRNNLVHTIELKEGGSFEPYNGAGNFTLDRDPSITILSDGFASVEVSAVKDVSRDDEGSIKYIYESTLEKIPYRIVGKSYECKEVDGEVEAVEEERWTDGFIETIVDECSVIRLQPEDDKSVPPPPNNIDIYYLDGVPLRERTIYPHKIDQMINPAGWSGNFNGVQPFVHINLKAVRRKQITSNLFQVEATYKAYTEIKTQFYQKNQEPCTVD